jgi:PAS domain S-box-containing protein
MKKKELFSSDRVFNLLRKFTTFSETYLVVFSSIGEIKEINESAIQYFDLKKPNIRDRNFLELSKLREKAPGILKFLSKYLRKGADFYKIPSEEHIIKSCNTEWMVLTLSGEINDESSSASLILLMGKPLDAKKDQISLEDWQDYLNIIADVIPGSLYWKDKKGRYLGCNKTMVTKANLENKEDIVGKTDFDLWPSCAETLQESDHMVVEGSKIIENEEKVKIATGETLWFASKKAPLKDRKGQTIGILGNSLDITQRRQMEEALKIAKEEAEQANRVKTRFLQNMEHDLRTPCFGISKMADILASKEADPEKKVTLKQISDAAAQLLNMYNEVLDFDSIKSGGLPIVFREFSLRALFDKIMALEIIPTQSKKIELRSNLSTDIPSILMGDEHRVSRILLNLIGNAIKFTHQGFVALDISLKEKVDKENIVLKFVIEDSGIGIPEKYQKTIFDRFTRVTPSNQGKYQGSGLGLNIVQQFVEDLNGSIEVKSREGKGTKFTCTLPFKYKIGGANVSKPPKNKKKKAKAQAGQKNLKLLLIEDNVLARKFTMTLFDEELGIIPDVVGSGDETLKLTKNNRYDLIFMDIGLPDMTGYEVTKKIRASGKNKKTPIVALTAQNFGEATHESLEAGMDDYVVKPLEAEKAQEVINRWCFSSKQHHSSQQKGFSNRRLKDFDILDLKKTPSKRMLSLLIGEIEPFRKNMEAAFDAKDKEALFQVAHKFHGGTCYTGTPRLERAANDLEVATKENPKILRKCYNSVNEEIDRVVEAYKKLSSSTSSS